MDSTGTRTGLGVKVAESPPEPDKETPRPRSPLAEIALGMGAKPEEKASPTLEKFRNSHGTLAAQR